MRIVSFLLVAALAFASAACSTPPKDKSAQKASTYEGEGDPKIKFGDKTGGNRDESSEGGSNVLGWALAPFENVVYLPWKLIGGGVKGASDGVRAGFDKDRMPFLALIFSPVNALVGFGTGAVEGVALKPVLVGPGDSFGHAMAQPTKHATTIWWYE